MKNTVLRGNMIALSALIIAGGLTSTAFAQAPKVTMAERVTIPSVPSADRYAQLAPKTQTRNTRLDYSVLDEALEGTVIRLGQSIRRHMSKPTRTVGTRLALGHQSPYRLEGSRVSFYFLSDEYQEEFSAYRDDLVRIANQIDLTVLNKTEQLAFWLNLHNVVMIDEIAKQWPVKRASQIKIGEGKVPLNEAKLITIKGVDLSLKNIREDIVFRNWDSSLVMYGFFYGDIGSPALQNYAYTRDNVYATLDMQAREFVNSLRGFNEGNRTRNVSRLYRDAAPYYFADFDNDVTTHLLTYARDDVAEEINADKPIALDRYETITADLVGGSRPRIAGRDLETADGRKIGEDLPGEVIRLLRELDEKTNTLRQRNQIGSSRVIIEDLETFDEDPAPEAE